MSQTLHHLPGALQTPGPTPAPIAMPERPASARTDKPSERTVQRWAHIQRVADQARSDGYANGERAGYTQGWRWGLWCGLPLGALLASAALAIWLTVSAPDAAPPSARPTVTTRL